MIIFFSLPRYSSDGYLKTFNFTQTATSMQPKISSVQIANDNSTIAVTMNEPVYRTTGGSGALEKEDFALSFREETLPLHPLHPPPSLSAGMSTRSE